MKPVDSPFTVAFFKKAKQTYDDAGLFWAGLIELTGMFLVTNDRWLLMKFGSSGCGKTISDRVAIRAYAERLRPLQISGRLTPAGMAKLMKAAENNPSKAIELEQFRRAELIFVEDLSRCTTHYLKLTSLQFLAGLTKTTHLDDITSEGGTLGLDLGEKPKKCMVSGTPSDWEEISSTSLYNEFIDRRSLCVITLMAPREWQAREKLARSVLKPKEDWLIELEWKSLIDSIGIQPYYGPIRSRQASVSRDRLYEKLASFKRYPENIYYMIDSLAEGHARLNGRADVLPEDYDMLDKLFSRFLVLADMKKKELFFVEELVRSTGILTLDEMVYRLRRRAKREDLPELEVVQKTVLNYASASKYLQKLNRGGKSNPVQITLSQYLWSILNTWHKEVKEMIESA